MVTIYDLLEVNEKASKEEIEKSYQKLVLEYHKDPKLTDEENADNEIILNKIKIAYDILMNDEKRVKYDKDLAKKRAEELIKNVTVSSQEEQPKEEKKVENVVTPPTTKVEETVVSNYNDDKYDDGDENDGITYVEAPKKDEEILTKDEQKKLKKAAQEEFKANLRKAQKAEEEYNKAYNEAYNNYMRKMGIKVKTPLTLKKILNTLLVIVVTIVVCFIAWMIPPVRNSLKEIYNENFIIKSLVDIAAVIIKGIISIFK